MHWPPNRWLKRASWVLALLGALLWPVAEAAEPKRVQIIHSFGHDFSPELKRWGIPESRLPPGAEVLPAAFDLG